jgi:hypothetical protein
MLRKSESLYIRLQRRLPGRTTVNVGEELVRREEAQAALEARRELGVEYEDHVVDALVEKIEQRLDERPQLKPVSMAPIAIPSLALSIPLIAVAGNFAGLAGVIAVCAAIVLVNLAASGTLRSAPRRRR